MDEYVRVIQKYQGLPVICHLRDFLDGDANVEGKSWGLTLRDGTCSVSSSR